MRIFNRTCKGALVLVGVVVLTSACSLDFEIGSGKDGSGVVARESFESDEPIDALTIETGFRASVTVTDGPASVSVALDDNFVEDLDVRVDGRRLIVELVAGDYDPDVKPTVEIQIPRLTDLVVGGASEVTVSDVVAADELGLDVGGASDVVIEVDASRLELDVRGSSDVHVLGTATTTEVRSSGASDVQPNDLAVERANVDLSGASTVALQNAAEVIGETSGASKLKVDSGAAVDVSTSGASSVDRD